MYKVTLSLAGFPQKDEERSPSSVPSWEMQSLLSSFIRCSFLLGNLFSFLEYVLSKQVDLEIFFKWPVLSFIPFGLQESSEF